MFDLIVIGGGPAGYLAAERAGEAGMNVCLMEKEHVGGVCLNEGCIPSKSLLYSAKIVNSAKHGEAYGVTVSDVSLDHKAVIARKNKVVNTLVSGIKMKLKKDKVTLIEGEAHIEGRDGEGFAVTCNGETQVAKRLLIATGSVTAVPPIPGLKEGLAAGFVLTNREILDLQEVPENLVVIGGGVIGLEMASYYNTAGSHVTIIEMLDHIAGPTDREISTILQKNYEKKGVEFKLNSRVTAVGADSVSFEADGQSQSIKCDKVLLSIGRRASTQGLGLENIGVLTDRGAVVTDDQGRTNIAGVYAAGDVNGHHMLAHVAYREAEVCINNMLGKKDHARYTAIPSVIYTTPEVGSMGETEETAKAKGMDVAVSNITMKYSGRYVAENERGDGICKIVVDKEHNRLVGVHLIGSYASEIIWGAASLIETELRIEDIKELVFPHPTVSEIIREAIFELKM